MLFGCTAPPDIPVYDLYKPVSAIYGRPPVVEGGQLPSFGGAGTGGFEEAYFVTQRPGYRKYPIVDAKPALPDVSYTPYADLMEEVKTGFGRTMSHLPAVFGVSRQTLYNWLSGEVPKARHQDKLQQLAAAARAFTEARFKPTPLCLERTVMEKKSFVELLSEGADGREIAQRLIRIVQRGTDSRAKLDDLLGDRKAPRLDVSSMGRPSLDEDA